MRFLTGPVSPFVGCALSVLRERNRSLKGEGACTIGGVGSCALACDEVGGVMGVCAGTSSGAGAARRDWRERHEEKMLPIAVWGES
jgi:hypothetical protein